MLKEVMTLHSEAECNAFAAEFAKTLTATDCLLLSGDLGAGKTTFCRALITALCHQPTTVVSPTFTLVETYDTTLGPLWHADLYRLNDEEEILPLGLADVMGEALLVIEWPELLVRFKPTSYIHVQLDFIEGKTEARVITIDRKSY